MGAGDAAAMPPQSIERLGQEQILLAGGYDPEGRKFQ